MKQITTSGMICLDDDLGFTYKIASIDYVLYEDESYTYIFRPNYSVIELLPSRLFQGIPGLNLDLKKPMYSRENLVPVFISERTPGENRENLWELLEELDLEYLNRLEWLIRTKTRYSGDKLYVKRRETNDEKLCIDYSAIEHKITRSSAMIQKLLQEICAGNDLKAIDFVIDDRNRKAFYSLLMSLYRKEKTFVRQSRNEGIKKSAAQGNYRGRKQKEINDLEFLKIASEYIENTITSQVAADSLGISRSTFFRKLKQWKSR